MNASPHLRTLKWSAWLGWQIESNWADLRLFFLYLVVKPITGSLMLVCMYYAAKSASPTRVPSEFLPYVYISNACYGLVGTVMFGMSYVIVSDRENYGMLKYVFISPARFQTYMVGRGLARGLEGLVGGGVTIIFGLFVFDPVRSAFTGGIDVLWLAVFLAIGSVMLWSCGMILGSAVLNMHRNGMFMSEGIAGVVYFLSGVVFPISMLPNWLQVVAMSLPTTYWLEGMRRSLTGMPNADSPLGKSPFTEWSNWELAGALTLSTAVLFAFSQWFYHRNLQKAWRNGKIEETTGV
ncbi:ABC transporter permease [Zavarzinella formosa]|uniref:ABC transporter permease n=1 Tax=Zavarzinella formosa TaxID=360055 RepID=UPI00035FFCF3|nr:ABC transporter permease [Zavarzinella formosa]